MKNTTLNKYLALIVIFFCALTFGYGQILTFDFDGNTGDEVSFASNFNIANLSNSTITRGAGLTLDANADRFNAISWALNDIPTAVIGNDYMEFTIAPNSNYQFDITTIVFNIQRSDFGLSGISLRSSIDGYAANIDGEKVIADNDAITEVISFTVNQANSATAVTYRVYGYAESGVGTGGFEGAGDDIAVNGTVSAIAACGGTTATWTGTWDNVPDLTTPVVIAGNYNTASGSFSACSLTVNANFTLTIGDEDYVEVVNDIIVNTDGAITVRPQGSVIQLDDAGSTTADGTITVEKNTPDMNNWYEYIYWSSPVENETIGSALSESQSDRRFLFDGSKFLDAFYENNNDGTQTAGGGIDDIDDNNDDWTFVNGATTMTPGVGYASTHDKAGFIQMGPLPWSFKYTFVGRFNNGDITVPVYRNDGELDDNNWNFIGNPYPSAIDADLFLATNTDLDTDVNNIGGALFLWSQNTAPSDTENGNQNLNFAASDYAIINATGQTAGGDGVIPNRFIPSGQGFFVSLSDAATVTLVSGDIYTADVMFNNSMRVKGATDNSQFFRSSNKQSKTTNNTNKLWLDLTSDNGVFNQALIGYVNGATINDDGMAYDAAKNLSAGASAILYSNIVNSNKKFAIQGKAESSLNEDEVISLGFKTTINVATIYTLSIAQLEGDFLSNNAVYVKDNLLNILHDLKGGDYNFTSEVGEFNERFEIVFNPEALSTAEHLIKTNALSIIELQNGGIQFKLSGSLTMVSVQIIDLQGRILYNLNASGNSKTYNLSNLSQAPYIAKVTLTDGYVITKKAIKKH